MLVVHGASRPSKILQDRYLAKLMARRRISFAICYITFKTRISFEEHMKRGAHLLAPGAGRVCEGIHVVAEWDQCGGTKYKRERRFTPVISETRLLSLCQHLPSTKFVSTGNPNNIINRQKTHHRKRFCNFPMWGTDHH